ncbi:MAG: pseudouridine synthase [Bacteroidota bacterium]
MSEGISLNKYIAERGYCSRRKADELLRAGRVMLNGQVARPGNRVMPGDEVLIDGQSIAEEPPPVYILLNKPAGITVTADPRIEDNVIDFIGYPERIFPVGRLDKPSEGLLLLTNDGDLSNQLIHARNLHEKEYLVTLSRPYDRLFLDRMGSGVPILDTVTRPCQVEGVDERRFKIILTQGLNRQIRRMCETLGYYVRRLERIRFLNLTGEDLDRGEWRKLTGEELKGLRHLAKNSR